LEIGNEDEEYPQQSPPITQQPQNNYNHGSSNYGISCVGSHVMINYCAIVMQVFGYNAKIIPAGRKGRKLKLL